MLKFIFYLLSLFPISTGYLTANDLKYNLLINYDRDNIPIQETPLNVSLEIVLSSVNNVDQIDGIVSYNIWLRYFWNDHRLSWNRNETEISKLTFNTDPLYETSIWTPDIILYNDANINSNDLKYTRVIVNSNGDVFWSRPGTINSMCDFDLEDYPYDSQNCYLKFGSWSYSENYIVLHRKNINVDLEHYKENEEWILTNSNSKLNLIKYSCCSESFYDITYHFDFDRVYSYYEKHILFPAYAISFLNLIAIFIPWDSGERISFAVTVMLSVIVFLLLVSDDIPKTNQNPLLSRIISLLTIFSFTCVIFIVFINYLNNFREKEIEEKKNHNINNFFIKFIYNSFKKIRIIKDLKEEDFVTDEENNERPISYNEAINNNMRFARVNYNLLKIIKYLRNLYLIFFTFFYICICFYAPVSI